MSKVAYLQCASGVSGDMMLGALVDAGVPLESIQSGIATLGLPDTCRLESEEVLRYGFRATKVHVRHEPEHAHRHLRHIAEMIDASSLTASQRDLAQRIFRRLAEAEAKVHGTTIEKVHFHEVGAIDSIVDIVGVAIAWDILGADRLVCSAVPTGHGTVHIAHGVASIPAPATAELLKGVPIAPSDVQFELTTPTGAAIVATLADSFGGLPPMTIEGDGCGAGDKDLEKQANVLRILVGTAADSVPNHDRIQVLETNIDDTSGEVVAHCLQQLMEAGALDAYTTAIQMKKGRPATKITVLCHDDNASQLQRILFNETTTLGIRGWTAHRQKLPRATGNVNTPWGPVEGKVVTMPDGRQRFSPEYESCRALATEHTVAIQRIMDAAIASYDSDS